jgi:FkbM family methyltransferase
MQFANAIKRSILKVMFSPFRRGQLSFKQVKYRGKKFVVPANGDIGWRLISRRGFEDSQIANLERLIAEEDLCLDVGGNIGIYTVFMASKATRGKVVTFEPVRLNRNVLEINVALNGLQNVEIMDLALSDSPGFVQFAVAKDGAYSSILATGRGEGAVKVLVETTTLDEMFASKGKRVDVIKMDVEGAELLVLKGGRNLLSHPGLRPKALLVEISEQNFRLYGYAAKDIFEYMESLGYRHRFVGDPGLRAIFGRTSSDANAVFE